MNTTVRIQSSRVSPGVVGRSRGQARAAFTLIEVILAIVISLGMLVVVLFFYQQTANFRAQLVEETERLTAVRLILDRLTSELRTARTHPEFAGSFVGSASSIQFIRTDAPTRAAWIGAALGRVESAQTDLRVVRYELRGGSLASPDSPDNLDSEGFPEFLDGETNAPPASLVRTEEPLTKMRIVTDANSAVPAAAPPAKPPPQPLTSAIQYLRFRYWDGSAWSSSWSGTTLPKGVEVSLGSEPPADDQSFDEFEYGNFYLGPGGSTERGASSPPSSQPAAPPLAGAQEEVPKVFRRVIYLPGSSVVEAPVAIRLPELAPSEPVPGEAAP